MGRGGALFLAFIACVLAFWLGGKVRHSSLAAHNHRVAVTREREARDTKSATFWAAVAAAGGFILYVVVALSGVANANGSPGPSPSPSHSTQATTHPTTPPAPHSTTRTADHPTTHR